MQKITDKRKITAYSLLFMLFYLASYVTRINFAAIVSEISQAENLPKEVLSWALSGTFITYGAGQVLSGFLGDKIQPKALITCGFVLTSAMNLLIPICPNPYLMTVVWCINGFAQSFMWPPVVKIMGEIFSAEDYSKACVTVSWGSSLGTILIYLVSPLIISISGWRTVFFASSAVGIAVIFAVLVACPRVEATAPKKNDERASEKNPLFSPVMLMVMLAIVLQGALRDGVTTWMPSYIQETYRLDNEIAILTGVVLPIFSIICYHIASVLHRKKFRNPLTCAAVFFGTGLAASVVLSIFSSGNPALSIFLSALISGSMHGVNLMVVCMVPIHFKKYGRLGFASGLLNAFTYAGSAVSTYGVAVLCENAGWGVTISVWAAIALAGTVICAAFAKQYKKKIM